MGPGKSLELPPLEFTVHRTTPPLRPGKSLQLRIRNFIDYPPPRNRPGKSLELPPPSNSRNFIDYPPSKSARKIARTTPPLEFTELIDYPPPLNYPPPRIHGTSSTTPPSKSAGKIAPTTPPPRRTPLFRTLATALGFVDAIYA